MALSSQVMFNPRIFSWATTDTAVSQRDSPPMNNAERPVHTAAHYGEIPAQPRIDPPQYRAGLSAHGILDIVIAQWIEPQQRREQAHLKYQVLGARTSSTTISKCS